MHEIQNNLLRRKPRLKPLTLELPKQLQRIEEKLSTKVKVPLEQQDIPSSVNVPTPIQQFGSLEILKHGKI